MCKTRRFNGNNGGIASCDVGLSFINEAEKYEPAGEAASRARIR